MNEGLRAIYAVDPTFEPARFVDGVKIAYEMIVMSFADGDREVLKNLLSKDVYEGFVAAIDERESGAKPCVRLSWASTRPGSQAPR